MRLAKWVLMLAALGFVCPPPARADDGMLQGLPFLKLLKKYELYEPILDVLMEPILTPEPTPPITKVVMGVPSASARLEVLKFTGSVVIEGGDTSIFGTNWVKMRIPVEFRYEVDLSELKNQDVHFHAGRNVLKVKLPAVRLARVLPDHEGLEILEKRNPFFRSRSGWYEMKDRILREYLRPSSEVMAREKLAEAELIGRSVVHDFLQRVCVPVRAVDIVVE